MLVETHAWRPYPHRVKTTHDIVLSVMQHVADHGARVDAASRRPPMRADLAGKPVPLDYTTSDKVRTIDFRGYAYTRTPSEVSGALMTRYDETKPQVWKMPLRDDVRARPRRSTRRAPVTSCRPRMRRGSARS